MICNYIKTIFVACKDNKNINDMLSGYVFDPEKKTYRGFCILGGEWTAPDPSGRTDSNTEVPDIKIPGDLVYELKSYAECWNVLDILKANGFTENKDMTLYAEVQQ